MAKLINAWAKRIKWDDATLVGPYLTMYYNRDSFPKHYFGEGVEATFEGIKVIIPSRYDEYLTQIYGDYMKLPPENKQKVTTGTKVQVRRYLIKIIRKSKTDFFCHWKRLR